MFDLFLSKPLVKACTPLTAEHSVWLAFESLSKWQGKKEVHKVGGLRTATRKFKGSRVPGNYESRILNEDVYPLHLRLHPSPSLGDTPVEVLGYRGHLHSFSLQQDTQKRYF